VIFLEDLLNTPRLLIFALYDCHILFDLRFIFLSHSVILRWCHYFPSYLPLQLLTPTPVHRLAFLNFFLMLFLCLFHLTLIWRFLLLLLLLYLPYHTMPLSVCERHCSEINQLSVAIGMARKQSYCFSLAEKWTLYGGL